MKPRNQRIGEKKAYVKVEKHLSRKIYKCLYQGCNEKAVKSHSQQRNGPLKAISENGKVFRLDDSLQRSLNINTDELEYRFALMGIGESSTFPGFCVSHEAMFSIFENNELQINNEKQACMLFYRTFCYEKARKRREYERWKMLQEELSDVFGVMSMLRISPQIEGFKNHIVNNCDYNISKALEMLNDENYASLTTKWLKLDHNVNVSCSSTINLHLDNYIEYALQNEGRPLPSFTFNLIPSVNSSFVVVSWLKEFDEYAEWLDYSFSTKNDLEYYINRFSFCDSEDVCINPTLWSEVKDTKRFIDNIHHILMRGELSRENIISLIKLNLTNCSN